MRLRKDQLTRQLLGGLEQMPLSFRWSIPTDRIHMQIKSDGLCFWDGFK